HAIKTIRYYKTNIYDFKANSGVAASGSVPESFLVTPITAAPNYAGIRVRGIWRQSIAQSKKVYHPLSHSERRSAAPLFSGTDSAGKPSLQNAFAALFLLAMGEENTCRGAGGKDMARILRQKSME